MPMPLITIPQEEQLQRAVLAAADLEEYDMDASLDELEELARTAGAQVVGRMVQKRAAFDPATCLGSGRLEELRDFCQNNQVELVIFDHELSPAQQRNIENILDLPVVDRTTLILDIFAARARSSEGRLQVELAQLKYRLPRLAGQGTSLSRLGGGIGTRGPGEPKLETDRRHIRARITALERQLRELEGRRERLRSRRRKDGVTTVAIVGYTNVGKSTLLNTLTQAGVLAENKLFATLDPTARALTLPDGRTVLLIDTVGLVRRLPHHLVEAFQSTLEEAACADLVLNVCDISSPEAPAQAEVTTSLLESLGAGATPVVTVLNKCDALPQLPDILGENTVLISARTGYGLEALLETISRALPPAQRRLTLLLPYDKAGLENTIAARGKVLARDWRPEGLWLDALVEVRDLHLVTPYLLREPDKADESEGRD